MSFKPANTKKRRNAFQTIVASVNDIINSESQEIRKILKIMASFNNADRAYIFQNKVDELSDIYCTQIYEYNKVDISSQIENDQLLQFYYKTEGFEWLYDILNSTQSFERKISEASTLERAVLEPQDIKSILVVPIFIDNYFWGFIGYDDCRQEREWTQEDQLLLITVGTLLGSYISKIDSQMKLLEKEEFYKTLLENSFDGISIIDKKKRIIYQSRANKRILGYTNEEFKQLDIFELFHPEDLPKANDTFQFLLQNPGSYQKVELRYRHKEQHYINVEMTATNLLNKCEIKGIVVNFRDVTEQRIHEEKLMKKESHLKSAQSLGKIGSWSYDFINGEADWSDEIYKAYGLIPGDIEPTLENFFNVIHPEDKERIISKIQQSQKTLENLTLDFKVVRPSGEVRYVFSKTEYIYNKVGIPIGVFGTQQDITEVALIQNLVKDVEEKYKQIFNLSPVPMWVYNTDNFKFEDVNEAAVKQYGYSKEEFLNMTILDIRPDEDVRKVKNVVKDIRKKRKSSQDVYQHIKKNGERIYVDVRGSSIEINDNRMRLVIARDVTDRMIHVKTIEEQNKQLMEIAWIQSHVVRAPLATLMGLIQILKCNEELITDQFILDNILKSAEELDIVIKDIVCKAAAVESNLEKNSK